MQSMFLAGVFTVALLMTITWIVSLRHRDASLVDRIWGLSFVFANFAFAYQSSDLGTRSYLVLAIVTIWGTRLSWYIHCRNRGHAEDYRYQAMRREHGSRFWWYSFFSVFALQGALSIIISTPLLAIHADPAPGSLTLLDMLGVGFWLIGFVFEAGGDLQLSRFKRNPENKGQLLNTGLWAMTRHPNYFGDGLQWWSFYLIATSSPFGFWTVFSPIIMTFFLRYVSGVALLEKSLKSHKPGYDQYIANVPAFIPTPRSILGALRRP